MHGSNVTNTVEFFILFPFGLFPAFSIMQCSACFPKPVSNLCPEEIILLSFIDNALTGIFEEMKPHSFAMPLHKSKIKPSDFVHSEIIEPVLL